MPRTRSAPAPLPRRRLLAGLAATTALAGVPSIGRALMAGAAPDDPASRVDPNTPRSPWTGVGAVVVGESVFSGVAITRTHVLTAAHVVGSAQREALAFVTNATAEPLAHRIARVAVFPTAAFPYDDWAVLELSAPLPDTVRSYPVLEAVPAIGTVLTIVGYGASGRGSERGPMTEPNRAVKRVGRNVLDALTPRVDASARRSPFFLFDFDGPEGNGALGGPTLGNGIETCPAVGDSGSGAFVGAGDRLALAGINTLIVALDAAHREPSRFGYGAAGLLTADARLLAWLDRLAPGVVRMRE